MNFEHSEIKKDKIAIENFNVEFSLSSEYDLTIHGIETKDTIEISFKYRKVIWQEKDIVEFAKHFIGLIKPICSGSELILSNIAIYNSIQ